MAGPITVGRFKARTIKDNNFVYGGFYEHVIDGPETLAFIVEDLETFTPVDPKTVVAMNNGFKVRFPDYLATKKEKESRSNGIS